MIRGIWWQKNEIESKLNEIEYRVQQL